MYQFRQVHVYMDLIYGFLYYLLHGFLKNDTWIFLSCYMDLSNLLYGFVKVVLRISYTCCMFFFPNKTILSLTNVLKLLICLKVSIRFKDSMPWATVPLAMFLTKSSWFQCLYENVPKYWARILNDW